jgi:hypothetical protein
MNPSSTTSNFIFDLEFLHIFIELKTILRNKQIIIIISDKRDTK